MNNRQFQPTHHETRKKRGGQKGNRNARKHGFYSASLGPAEICRFWDLVNLKNVAPEVAGLTVKLRSLLQADPYNRRPIAEAAKLLVKWYSAKFKLGKTNTRLLRIFISGLLDRAMDQAISRSDHHEGSDA